MNDKIKTNEVDLSLIRDNLEEPEPAHYGTRASFRMDLDLMIANCKQYNNVNTEFWEAADTMEKFIEEVCAKYHSDFASPPKIPVEADPSATPAENTATPAENTATPAKNGVMS